MAHDLGYDKKAYEYSKKKYHDVKSYLDTKWTDHKNKKDHLKVV